MIINCRVPELAAAVATLTRGPSSIASAPIATIVRTRDGLELRDREGALVYATPHGGDLLCRLEMLLDDRRAEIFVGHSVFHAACAACGDEAIVVAGASESGKSTTVAALVERGLEYATDDVLVLGDAGEVIPYARPLKLREGGRALLGDVEGFEPFRYQLGSGAFVEHLVPRRPRARAARATVLAFLERSGATLALDAIPASEALARLMEHAYPGDLRAGLERARRLVAAAATRFIIRGGSPREIAEALTSTKGR